MSLLIKGGGITKLSKLEIDTDKSWILKAITRLGGLDAGQVRGDIWTFNLEDHANLIVRRLPAGEEGKVLCSRGQGKPPFWAWVWEEPGAQGTLQRFYPALIDLTHDEWMTNADRYHDENTRMASWHRQVYDDAPADHIRRLTPTVGLNIAGTAGITPDESHGQDAAMTSEYETTVA